MVACQETVDVAKKSRRGRPNHHGLPPRFWPTLGNPRRAQTELEFRAHSACLPFL